MRASFCSLCPARLGFSLFFPAFSLAAGHHRLPFDPHAPPASDFLSSSLFFLWRRGTTALFLLPCPARLRFSLFFPAFSLAAGHHSSFSSPMPRPPRIFSLLPCFFSGGGAPQLFFFSCAPPGSDFLSSSLFFSAGGAPQASFCSLCPARDALQPGPQPHSHKNSDVKAFLRISASTSSTCLPNHSGRTPYQNQVLHRSPPEDAAWRFLPVPRTRSFLLPVCFHWRIPYPEIHPLFPLLTLHSRESSRPASLYYALEENISQRSHRPHNCQR